MESKEISDVGSTNKLFKSFKIFALEGTRALSDAVLERMMVSTFRPCTSIPSVSEKEPYTESFGYSY